MKKLLGLLVVFMVVLSGCARLSPEGPETLNVEDEIYKTGFYGSLYPNLFNYENISLQSGAVDLHKIIHEKFELYHADIGSYTEGTIYCAEKDYESALAFYFDPNHYLYYCTLGVNSNTQTSRTVEMFDIDTNKFDALLEFADNSSYDPFNKNHNAKIEKVELPMPDDTKDIRLSFYKVSKDNLFTSSKGTDYYIFDHHLYAVYQYDFGHGEYEKLIAVKVPDDISDYFIEFLKPYM